VELADGVAGVLFGRHRDEAEPAGLARNTILHQEDFGHGTSRGEQVLEVILGRVE
jgi:hypothetical protein